jgi:hypothetical protein
MRWLSSLLVLALAGCVTPHPPVPQHLLLDCAAVQVPIKTNADLVLTIREQRKALQSCNDDKAALREHFKEKR